MAQNNISPSTGKRIAAGGALGAIAIGGVVAAGAHKNVVVDYNGQQINLATYAGNVDGALKKANVNVKDGDLVYPAPSEKLSDNETIKVSSAKQVAVVIDGQPKSVTSTATSVGDLISEVGGVASGSNIDQDTGARVTDGMKVNVTTPKVFSINDGSKVSFAQAPSATVADALKSQGVALSSDDRVTPGLDEKLTDNLEIKIDRVKVADRTDRAVFDGDATYVDDPNMEAGTEKVLTPGVKGERMVTSRVVTVNGVEESRDVLKNEVVKQAQGAKIARGTKAAPKAQAAPASTASTGSRTSSAAPAVSNGSTWDSIAQCESGGNWSTNTGNGFSGGLQFTPSTWAAYGGNAYASDPSQASREQQIAVAEKVQASQGWGAWPACTSKLGIR